MKICRICACSTTIYANFTGIATANAIAVKILFLIAIGVNIPDFSLIMADLPLF